MMGQYSSFADLAFGTRGFAISSEQKQAALSPSSPLIRLAGKQPVPAALVRRPYLIWRDDLELARRVNDGLAPPRGD
jgi:hypothetical protein